MRSIGRGSAWLATWAMTALLAAACSSDANEADSNPGQADEAEESPASSAPTATTTTLPNRPPELRVPALVRADVGETWTDAIVASDPDGDTFTIWVEDRPRDLFTTTTARGVINGFEWQPTDAGQWFATVVAADSEGNETRATIELLGRYPSDGDLLLALGDSVAAGFGRDRSDFVSGDGCFRSEQDAYPALVFEALVDAGSFAPDAHFLTATCRDARASSLAIDEVRVTDERGDVVDDDIRQSQIDWAVRSNPTVITLTVGATDVGLADPERVAAGLGDAELVQLEAAVGQHLDALLASTDAHIAVTTYPLVVATDPDGVDGCDEVCFLAAAEDAWTDVAAAIESAAAPQPPERVSLVDIRSAFEGHRSANGLGPDALRGLFDGPSNAFCADGDGPDETWVSRLDCWHPNGDGQRAIADAVLDVLLQI